MIGLPGYQYAGLQAGYACLCGDSYGKHGPLPESRCVLACPGDATQNCGGWWANDVYRIIGITHFNQCHSYLVGSDNHGVGEGDSWAGNFMPTLLYMHETMFCFSVAHLSRKLI